MGIPILVRWHLYMKVAPWFSLYCFETTVLQAVVARIILCMRPANERRRYIVTSSLIGWVHTQIDPCCSRMLHRWGNVAPERLGLVRVRGFEPCIIGICGSKTVYQQTGPFLSGFVPAGNCTNDDILQCKSEGIGIFYNTSLLEL